MGYISKCTKADLVFQSWKIETCTGKERKLQNNQTGQKILKFFGLIWNDFSAVDYRRFVKDCFCSLGQACLQALLPKFAQDEVGQKNPFDILSLQALNHAAFTLAEVLIVIGIIGVVANMTIPTLMHDVQEKSFNTSWRKSFSALSSTARQLAYENGETLAGLFSDGVAGKTAADGNIFRDVFLAKMKATKVCDVNTAGCWADEYYTLGKTTVAAPTATTARATLADGTYIYFDAQADPDLCNSVADGKNTSCGNIAVDVNGSKKPNMIGKDIFGLWVSSSGKIGPIGTSGDFYYGKTNFTCDVNTYPSTSGWNCSSDYLFK